jgi:acetyl esterase/lipase
VDAQVLLYPALSPARGSPFSSYEQNADGPLMTRREMVWFWDHYLRDAADGSDPRAAPLAAPDLAGLPPTTVVVCELDVLRDEGLAYAERLRASGVPTSSTVYAGAAHGFWWMDAEMTQAAELTASLAVVLRGEQSGLEREGGEDGPAEFLGTKAIQR